MENNITDKVTTTSNEDKATRNYASTLSQCLAAFATNIVKFSFGTFFGFTAVLTAELSRDDADIQANLNEITWFGSSCFMIPIGSIVFGLLAQLLGCRVVLLIATIIFTTCWLIFHWSTSIAMLLISQAMIGLSYSISLVPGLTYTAEITEARLRSTLLATSNLFILIGSFFTVLLSSLLHWRTITLINLIFPILGFVAVSCIPESPYWLMSKGRFAEAERSLSWLRGWVTADEVKIEFNSIKLTCRDSSVTTGYNFKDIRMIYSRKTFYLPLLTCCYVFVMHALTGSLTLMIYIVLLFKKLESPLDQKVAAVIFDALKILAAIICVATIRRIGKRNIMFVSLFGNGVSYLIIAIVVYALKRNIIASEFYHWIPTIAMCIASFLSSGGIDKVVYMLNVELLPTEYRNVGTGISYLVSSLCQTIVSKIFLYLIDILSVEGVYLGFAVANFIALITFYRAIPETDGKTLEEIEDYYANVKSLGFSRFKKETKFRANT